MGLRGCQSISNGGSGVYVHYLLIGGVFDRGVVRNAIDAVIRIQVFVECDLE